MYLKSSRGAHHAGGTELTLYGAGFLDLGEPLCAFGYDTSRRGELPLDPYRMNGNMPPWNISKSMELTTPATILGPHEARCHSPSVANHPSTPIPVELLLNGDRETKSRDGRLFTIYGQPGATISVFYLPARRADRRRHAAHITRQRAVGSR